MVSGRQVDINLVLVKTLYIFADKVTLILVEKVKFFYYSYYSISSTIMVGHTTLLFSSRIQLTMPLTILRIYK